MTTGPSNASVDGWFLGVSFSVGTGKRHSTLPDLPPDGTTALDYLQGFCEQGNVGIFARTSWISILRFVSIGVDTLYIYHSSKVRSKIEGQGECMGTRPRVEGDKPNG